jgi:hypothetical protein
MRRPNPVLWLYYVYGGRLSERHREWVRYDGTCRTWLLRALARGLAQIAPIDIALFVGLLAFGISWPLAAGAVLLGILVSIRYALSYAVENVDTRLARHGYPAGHGSATREQAARQRRAAEQQRYRAAYRPDIES